MYLPPRVVAMTGLALVASAVLTLGGAAQTQGSPARYTAMAVDMDNGRTSTVDMVVNRWSTESERKRLLAVLAEKGPEKLLDVLQDIPRVGYFRTPQSVGWDLHYATLTPMPEGGERVVLATDRRIPFWEARNRPRSIDYPFTVIELRLNRDGVGEGKMSIATKITFEKEQNTIVLENYGTQPVLLQSVRRERASQ
jgi:hypothetical protein